jgi:hypothetical protein
VQSSKSFETRDLEKYQHIVSTMSISLIYVELLANIRTVSVIAALDSPCDTSTKIELSPNGQQFTLRHGRDTIVITLPGRVAGSSLVQKIALGARELSWRLPIVGGASGDPESIESPWTATSMKGDMEFICRNCKAIIVKRGSVTAWKDLPSENWAEMMDFWHCHKPSEHEHTNGHGDDPNTSKGYGANTKFTAQISTGFVDLTSLLLAETDCNGVEVSYELYHRVLRLRVQEVWNGYQEGGQALHFAFQWPGHRYKYPRLTPGFHSAPAAVDQAYPLSPGLWVTWADWRIFPRQFHSISFLRF